MNGACRVSLRLQMCRVIRDMCRAIALGLAGILFAAEVYILSIVFEKSLPGQVIRIFFKKCFCIVKKQLRCGFASAHGVLLSIKIKNIASCCACPDGLLNLSLRLNF